MLIPTNADLKLGRAKVHFDALSPEVSAFEKSKPYRITSKDDTENGTHVIKIEISTEVPDNIGLLAGDFISCLRASLDYLAWDLALITTTTPFKDTCFPIRGIYDGKGATERYISKVTQDIPSNAVTIIRNLQPYCSGSAYRLTHLWRLNKLWNIDKHRRIPIIGSMSGEFLKLPIGTEAQVGEVDNCHTLTIPLSAKRYMRFDPNPSVRLNFGGDEEEVAVTVDDLLSMYEFVSQNVMPRFARLFPKRKAMRRSGLQKVFGGNRS